MSEKTYREELIYGDAFLSKKEVAKILKVHPGTIDRLVRDGKLKKSKISNNKQGHCRYEKTAVFDFLLNQVNSKPKSI